MTLTSRHTSPREGIDEAFRRLFWKFRWHLNRLPERLVEHGLPAGWLGYRWAPKETVRGYFARHGAEIPSAGAVDCSAGSFRTIHPESVARNPLPRNVRDLDELPADPGWWGYSFHDVPARRSLETFIATLPDCRMAFYTEGEKNNFYPGILNRDGRGLHLREIVFRPGHGKALRRGRRPLRVERATWIAERVYHNHSHWLTAHLPKLCLLKELGGLEHVMLPKRRNAAIDASLRLLGLDPAEFRTFDPDVPLEVEELTVLGTDRFRPELLRPVRAALVGETPPSPWRRVFISRAKSRGRRLVNEAELWPMLEKAGFERVLMEELAFDAQVRLMSETAVLLAPHGAGLTNMMFCPAGSQVVEIADLSYPNPNFYALASAMGLGYWLIRGAGIGSGHPLDQDLVVDPASVAAVLGSLEEVS